MKSSSGARGSAGAEVIILTNNEVIDDITIGEEALRTKPATIHAIAIGVCLVYVSVLYDKQFTNLQEKASSALSHIERLKNSILITVKDSKDLQNNVTSFALQLNNATEKAFVCRCKYLQSI